MGYIVTITEAEKEKRMRKQVVFTEVAGEAWLDQEAFESFVAFKAEHPADSFGNWEMGEGDAGHIEQVGRLGGLAMIVTVQ